MLLVITIHGVSHLHQVEIVAAATVTEHTPLKGAFPVLKASRQDALLKAWHT